MDARAALAAEGIQHRRRLAALLGAVLRSRTKRIVPPVLGSAPRIGIEAAGGFGWERWLGTDGVFIGMTGFGASAPYEDLYQHFGITPDAIAAAVRGRARSG